VGRKPGRPATSTSPARIEVVKRAAAVMGMRLQGWSLRAIGEMQTPPCSPATICRWIADALAECPIGAVEEVRSLELLRLDELQTGIYERAIAGDLAAADRVLAIQMRRARLAGLDAQPPVRFGFGGDDGCREPTVRVEIVGSPDIRMLPPPDR